MPRQSHLQPPIEHFETVLTAKGGTFDREFNLVDTEKLKGYLVGIQEVLPNMYSLHAVWMELYHHWWNPDEFWTDHPKVQGQEIYLGFWFNEDNNLWYVDFVQRFETLEQAALVADDNQQIAIWDCENGEVLNEF